MPRITKHNRHLYAAAKRMRDAGITIDMNSAYSWVSIDAPGEESIFMQGEEADNFVDECENLSRRYRSVSRDVIELALAEPYAETLWN